jgi:hypothetical protein
MVTPGKSRCSILSYAEPLPAIGIYSITNSIKSRIHRQAQTEANRNILNPSPVNKPIFSALI